MRAGHWILDDPLNCDSLETRIRGTIRSSDTSNAVPAGWEHVFDVPLPIRRPESCTSPAKSCSWDGRTVATVVSRSLYGSTRKPTDIPLLVSPVARTAPQEIFSPSLSSRLTTTSERSTRRSDRALSLLEFARLVMQQQGMPKPQPFQEALLRHLEEHGVPNLRNRRT